MLLCDFLRIRMRFIKRTLVMISTSPHNFGRIVQSSLQVVFLTKLLGQFCPAIVINIIVHCRFRFTNPTIHNIPNITNIVDLPPRSPHHEIAMLILLHCLLLSLYFDPIIIFLLSSHILLFLPSFLLYFTHSCLLRLL